MDQSASSITAEQVIIYTHHCLVGIEGGVNFLGTMNQSLTGDVLECDFYYPGASLTSLWPGLYELVLL